MIAITTHPARVSRRTCLTWMLRSSALAGVSCAIAHAGEPSAHMPTSVSIPVQPRLIRLKPVHAHVERTVVTAIAMDPRGRFVAAAGDDHAIRILSAETLAVVETLHGHRDLVRTLAFDPRGQRLASAGNDGQLILWDRDNSFRIAQRMQQTPALACVRFSPSGNELAAVGFDDQVFLIGTESTTRPQLHCGCTDLRAIAYRSDGRMLVVGGRVGDLHLFDAATGQQIGDHNVHQGRIRDIAFQKDASTVVSVGEDGRAVVFDTRRRKMLHSVNVTTSRLFAVAVIDSQHVAVAGSDNAIRIVNTHTGAVTRQLEGHHGSIASLAASGNWLFSGGYDASLRRWPVGALHPAEQRIAEGESTLER